MRQSGHPPQPVEFRMDVVVENGLCLDAATPFPEKSLI